MASNRIGRINEEIQRELSSLIRTVKDPRVHGLVSITAVDTTPDLRYAKIFVSVLDKSDVKEVVKGLRSAGGYLRRELGRSLQPVHPGAHLCGGRLHRRGRAHPGAHRKAGPVIRNGPRCGCGRGRAGGAHQLPWRREQWTTKRQPSC